jgi:uncharacterized protein YceK
VIRERAKRAGAIRGWSFVSRCAVDRISLREFVAGRPRGIDAGRVRRASRIGAAVLAVALAATSGCASAIMTPKQPVPFAGSQLDIIYGSEFPHPLAIAALLDLVPSFGLDTILLPVTLVWASQSDKWIVQE